MTDFGSQGKTHPNNVVDLNNLLTHQYYYTALSRSATAQGTIILQGFDPHKITGHASGVTFSPYFTFTPPYFLYNYLIPLVQGHMAIHAALS